MNLCHSCLKESKESFCAPCTRKLFGGKKISHILNFTRPEFNEVRLANSDKLSISGIQVKYSLTQKNKELVLTEEGGRYIIKPVPYGPFKYMEFIPANEHLTMQVANQIFSIKTPPNALVFFKNDEPTYIVKRFDVLEDDRKLQQEDFAQIANKTEDSSGKNYKYDYSYEEIALLMKKHIAAYPIEIERFYSLVIFNYLVGNGDAHLKNFSVFRNEKFGDYTLTPAYDLMSTNIHIENEADTALELFKDNYMTESFRAGSKYTNEDFTQFGLRIGIKETRIKNILQKFSSSNDKIYVLVERSFLSDELKAKYVNVVNNRCDRLKF